MIAITPGTVSGASNPVLDAWTISGSILTDPFALSFQVFEIADDESRSRPTQVWPVTAGQRATVDLEDDKVGTGHFAAAWTVPDDATLGTYEIRWYATPIEDAPEVKWRREFEVREGVSGFGQYGYALVSDLRAEGIAESDYSDAKLQRLIERASRFVERATRRYFEPRYETLVLSGVNTPSLLLPHVPIGVESITNLSSLEVYDATEYVVSNRHLAGMTYPDDRHVPCAMWKSTAWPWTIGVWSVGAIAQGWPGGSGRRWPGGVHNLQVAGLFGYTDRDGSFTGDTPEEIRRVTQLLVIRDLAKLGDTEDRAEATRRYPISQESTRDQSVSYAVPRGTAASVSSGYTGDDEIDGILMDYQRPGGVSVV